MNKEEIRKHLEAYLKYLGFTETNKTTEQYLSTLPDEPKERYFVVFVDINGTKTRKDIVTRDGNIFNSNNLISILSQQTSITIHLISITDFKELSKQDFEYFIK